MNFRVLLACVKCGRIFDYTGLYDLNRIYGRPAKCPRCQHAH